MRHFNPTPLNRTIDIIKISPVGQIPILEVIRMLPSERKLILVFEKEVHNLKQAIGQNRKTQLVGFQVGIHATEPEINIAKVITDKEIEDNQDFFEQCAKDYRKLGEELLNKLVHKLDLRLNINFPMETFNELNRDKRQIDMKKTTILLSTFLLLFSTGCVQRKKDMKIDFMLRGLIYAKSSIEDTTAFGGFGSSRNLPKLLPDENTFSEKGVFLKIDTTKIVALNDKYNGYRFYIGNKSDTILRLDASDSRLNVITQVLYKGEWKPIEYLPGSWCGNSHHLVYLKQNEYWEFIVPKFSGKIKTKLRFRLMIGSDNYIYSNEIETRINKGQMTKKEKQKGNGIMDPYSD